MRPAVVGPSPSRSQNEYDRCMASPDPRKSVAIARIKTAAVQNDVQQAEADLHDANEVLADTVEGTVATRESLQAALVQNLNVEGQLHDAVKELQVVKDLLNAAEGGKPPREREESTVAGRRSGEGADSVLEHMNSAAKRKDLSP
jgi:hypothetical protein